VIDIQLQPALGDTTDTGNGRKGKSFKQKFVNEDASFGRNRLASGIFDKLPQADLTAEARFAVVGVSVLDNLVGLALWAVHKARQKVGSLTRLYLPTLLYRTTEIRTLVAELGRCI